MAFFNDFDSRITVDYDAICKEIEIVLEEMQVQRSNKLFSKPLGDKYIAELRQRSDAIRKRLSSNFQLVVIGDFKRGKSTLINAILGDYVVPTAVTPETVTINRLTYGEVPSVQAVLRNHKRIQLSLDELPREKLDELIAQIPDQIDYVDIKINNELLKDIMIVDTPGLGDTMSEFDEQIASYLVNADAIIYVMSARSPLSFSEQSFLSSIVMPQSFSKIYLAVNMADTLETPENITKITDLIEERTTAIGDNFFVFPVSALDEFCRKTGRKRPDDSLAELMENCFADFMRSINQDVILQKEAIKSIRGLMLTRSMLADLKNHINISLNAIKMNVEDMEKAESALKDENSQTNEKMTKEKEKLARKVKELNAQTQIWMKLFFRRLKAEVLNLETQSASDLNRFLQFYIGDTIKEALFECVQYHQKTINDIIVEYSKELYVECVEHSIKGVDSVLADNMNYMVWAGLEDAHYAANLFVTDFFFDNKDNATAKSIYINLNSALVKVLIGASRESKVKKSQKDILAPILNSFDAIEDGMMSSIEPIYNKLTIQAQTALDDFYLNQISVSSDAIENARKSIEIEGLRVQDIQNEFADVINVINECDARLEKLI